MLVIKDRERFDVAKAHARKIGLTDQFAQVLEYLRTYGEHTREELDAGLGRLGEPTVRVTLYNDFAPHSFSILWERREPGFDLGGRHKQPGEWKYWFNGGLIFHGPHDNGGDGGAPTFSVNLSPHHGWSIHT